MHFISPCDLTSVHLPKGTDLLSVLANDNSRPAEWGLEPGQWDIQPGSRLSASTPGRKEVGLISMAFYPESVTLSKFKPLWGLIFSFYGKEALPLLGLHKFLRHYWWLICSWSPFVLWSYVMLYINIFDIFEVATRQWLCCDNCPPPTRRADFCSHVCGLWFPFSVDEGGHLVQGK